MNTQTNMISYTANRKRRRFCDRFGLTGLICLGLFFAFAALLEHAGQC